MANTMRWRYGETNPVIMAAAADADIEIGDLVYAEGSVVRPANEQFDEGTLNGNQQSFHNSFVGVAMQCSPAGSTDVIRIATTGVFEYTCPAATFDVGDFIGVNDGVGGDPLNPQEVVSVAGAANAIGRCVKQVDPAATSVLVDIVSTIVKGGPQAAA